MAWYSTIQLKVERERTSRPTAAFTQRAGHGGAVPQPAWPASATPAPAYGTTACLSSVKR